MKPKLMDDLDITGFFTWDGEASFLADTLCIVGPVNILETGFFCGASTFMWLYLSNASVTSVDPMINLENPNILHNGKPQNVQKLKDAFPNRLTFLQKDSRLIRPDMSNEKFDLMFIDGDHTESGVRNDFQLAIDLNIPWVLVDDFNNIVSHVYQKEFANELFIVRLYPRKELFQGNPIPIALLRRVNHNVINRLSSTSNSN